MKPAAFFFSTFGICAALVFAAAEPPKVVSISPAFWAVGVNPGSQRTVSITFNEPMVPGFTAWLGRSSLAPPEVDLNSTVSQDRKTFEMKVGLQPGKVYVFALNEKGIPGVGFQNDKGSSLPPTFLVFQTSGNIAAQDAPPKIVRSMPPHGAAVDAARLTSISITFDKPMNRQKHGLHIFENNNPVDLSKAQFSYSTDGATFTLPYNFKRGTQYRLELNNIHDIGFSSANRIPLWPAQIAFATAP